MQCMCCVVTTHKKYKRLFPERAMLKSLVEVKLYNKSGTNYYLRTEVK